MKKIFSSNEIEVLSLEGLKYTTNFDQVISGSSHIPVFDTTQEKYYVQMGEELRGFVVNKTLYGFRYYDDYGELSPFWTAVFCQLEGEDSECVILGRYYQNADADFMDSCWELPYGYYRPDSSYPRVFYKSKDAFVKMECYRPNLYKVNQKFIAYRYDVIEHKVVTAPIQIDKYYWEPYRGFHVEKHAVDNEVWFDNERDCIISHRKQIVSEDIDSRNSNNA